MPPPSPPPPPPPDLADDAISEILLRLPPDEPQWLFRAALVCKAWLRTLSDPAFLSRYRGFHGAPPLLGLVDWEQRIEAGQHCCSVPTTAVPAFPIPVSDDYPFALPLDCRHGRVLVGLYGGGGYFLVGDPVTGDRHRVPYPEIPEMPISRTYSAAVFCAAAGCDHLDCRGRHFRLVRVFTASGMGPTVTMWAAMYSSEIGAWRAPVMLENVPYVPFSRGPLIGDEIYFGLPEDDTIVKYDWANNVLFMVEPQPPAMHGYFELMEMEGHSLGLADIEDSRLHLWSRRVSTEGIAKWVQCMVIDLGEKMPMANPSFPAFVAGFAEGVGVIFVSTGVGLFMMELKSGRVRKVDEAWDCPGVLPYMSFYTPDRLLGRPADL